MALILSDAAPVLYNPDRVLREDWRAFFVKHRRDRFILECIEGPVTMSGARMLLNMMLCMPLIVRKRPISLKHLTLEGLYSSKVQADVENNIVDSLEELSYGRLPLGPDIMQNKMAPHSMVYTNLGAYHLTIDIFGIADTILQPELRPYLEFDYGDVNDKDIMRMEKLYRENCEKLDEVIRSDELPINVFRAPLLCGALKAGQFRQFLGSRGPADDVDDHMFKRPVIGSYLSGMTGAMDVLMESRPAAKAKFFSKEKMSDAAYLSRKVHIQNAIIGKLYPGDCGTTVYADYTVNHVTFPYYKGKWFVGKDGQLTELTTKTMDEVIGKETRFRSVGGCQHTNGYCEVCGGTLTKTFSHNGNLGFLANVKATTQAGQQVLSAKHLTVSTSITYHVPGTLDHFLTAVDNQIYVKPSERYRAKNMALGFRLNDVNKLRDLRHQGKQNGSYFSDMKITCLMLGKMQDGELVSKTTRDSLKQEPDIYPHLSPQLLWTIKHHPEDAFIKENVWWFKLDHVNLDEPLMQCVVINNSIRFFFDALKRKIRNFDRYTSLSEATNDMAKFLWERVDPHITHVETMVRAAMVSGPTDFRIPVVTDPERIMFRSLNQTIPVRSIGSLLAYERFAITVSKPSTFVIPRIDTWYDQFLGTTDMIERDMHWPPKRNAA